MEEVEDSSPFSECRKLRLWIREESWSERLKIKRKGVKEREGLSINKERLVWMISVVVLHSLQKQNRQKSHKERKRERGRVEVKKRKLILFFF